MRRRFAGGLLALAVTLAFACTESDASISNKIRVKLDADRDINARQIQVTSNERVVTVSGSVPSEAAHQRVLKYARETEGVKDVKDELSVAVASAPTGSQGENPAAAVPGTETGSPGSAAPAAAEAAPGAGPAAPIAQAVKARLAADQKVGGDTIQVEAQGDTVILTGTVKSAEEKQQAVRVAQETQGVTKVEDRLTVSAS
jgi:hyperosmotically inducible protein